MSNTLFYPAVSGSPGSTVTKEPSQASDRAIQRDSNSGAVTRLPTESFNQILGSELQRPVNEPLKFSAHASARMQSRKLDMGPDQMRRLNEAVDKAAAKGLDDTLILTKDAAFIVNVSNRTVVTAMDRGSLDGNVFTNIDGAVII